MLKNILTSVLLVILLALGGCGKNQVAEDLKNLNMAGQSATKQIDLDKVMAKTQQATTPADKAALIQEAAMGFSAIQAEIQKANIKSPQVKELQNRMTAAFGKTAAAAQDAGKALGNSDGKALEQAGKAMMQGQQELIAVGQDLNKLAAEHKVELSKLVTP
jgi:hypothetical protein